MARFNADAGEGFLPVREAMKVLGVSRQAVWQRVKRGELEAVHVMLCAASKKDSESR